MGPLAHSSVGSIEQECEIVFDRRQSAGGKRIGLLFFFEGVRRVVGSDDLDFSVDQSIPKRLIVLRSFDRGVHLDESSKPLVIVDVETPMMRTDLGSDQSAVVLDDRNLLRGAHMQNMETMLVSKGEVQGASSRNLGGDMIADARMIFDGELRAQTRLIRTNGFLVLTVGTDWQRCLRKDSLERLLIIDQQVAGTGTHEDLDSGYPCGILEIFDVVDSSTDVETMIDDRLARCDRVLLFDPFLVDGGRFSVGHLEKRSHTPCGTCSARGRKIFFMSQAGFAKMDLVVDQARKEQKTFGIDHFIGGGSRRSIDAGDAPILHENMGLGRFFQENDSGISNQCSHRHGTLDGLVLGG